jgi:hypothetical protein
MTIGDHMRQFATPPGMIYAVLLLAFLLMPLLIGKRGIHNAAS